MKGVSSFSTDQASRIRALLNEKIRASSEDQKRIRDEIRAIGFYISDFRSSSKGFGPEDFDALVRSGQIAIADVR